MIINLTGKEFGPFEVIGRDTSKNNRNNNGKAAYWTCKCKLCGSLKSYRSDLLRKRCPASCGCAFVKIRVGDKLGHLTVVKEFNGKPSRSKHWSCQCDCGKTVIRTSRYLNTYSHGSCGCSRNVTGVHSLAFKGCGDLYASIFNRIKRGAVRRNMEFDITIEELWKLFQDQDERCALSGLSISFGKYSRTDLGEPCTASLDRISSEEGYLSKNIQWVHKDINIMKNKFSQEGFIGMCKTIADHNS